MNALTRAWRRWQLGRRCDRIGKHCRFGDNVTIKGHVELGDHVRLRDNVLLRTRGDGKIVFGDRCGCSWYCIIESTSEVRIGNHTGLAEFTVIHDSHHAVIGTDEHWRLTPLVSAPVIIGDDVLVASRCYIGPGVTIGNGAVIAPNSHVTKDVGPYEIWAGNPARKVGHRTEGLSETQKRRFQELLETYGIKRDRHGFVAPPEERD